MAWTTPVTWTAGQVVGASDLNAQLRDNMNAVFGGRALFNSAHIPSVDYTTTSTSFAAVDTANLRQTLTIASGRFMGWYQLVVHSSGTLGNGVYFAARVDGTTMDAGSTLSAGVVNRVDASTSEKPITQMFLFTGLSNASHYIDLMFRTTNAATTAIVKGNGSAYLIRMMGFEI